MLLTVSQSPNATIGKIKELSKDPRDEAGKGNQFGNGLMRKDQTLEPWKMEEGKHDC